MISFKDYLSEARMAPLYHGTRLVNLPSIFKEGIYPMTEHDARKLLLSNPGNRRTGISVTRSKDFASWYRGGLVLELDQQKLAQRYKIIPVQFWNNFARTSMARHKHDVGSPVHHRNEYEEFILTKKNIPFEYVTRIYLPKRYLREVWVVALIETIRQQRGSQFVVVT